MIKVTNERILLFRQNAINYRKPYAGKFSPFLYSLEKMLKSTESDEKNYHIEVEEINRSFAAKDKDGFYIREVKEGQQGPGLYKIKAEDEVKRDEAVRELLKKEVDIEPFVTPRLMEDLPKDIDFSWWTPLSPFVLPDLNDEILEMLYARDKKK
jgi:hypothetical protein